MKTRDNPEAVLIIGLPGSGKTYLAKTEYPNHALIDDPSTVPANLQLLLYHVNVTRWNMVITDPPLCGEKHRKDCIKFLKLKGYSVKCIFFENNEKKCRALINLRNDGRVITTFKPFNYTIPKNVKPMKIYSPE